MSHQGNGFKQAGFTTAIVAMDNSQSGREPPLSTLMTAKIMQAEFLDLNTHATT